MEKSVLSSMNHDYLINLGLKESQIKFIETLVQRAIDEKLYENPINFRNDIKHIERVMTYVQLILNEKEKKGEVIEYQNLLFLATLYHDMGSNIKNFDFEHEIIGAKEIQNYFNKPLTQREKEIFKKLINFSTQESAQKQKSDIQLTEEEKKQIQMLENILKDGNALDRNRLNAPPPIGTCDIKKLKTEEAKKILPKTDDFLFQYMTTIIKEKEKEKNQKILNNYDLLEKWINQYLENKQKGQEENGLMFHASQDPSIEALEPAESTQKGTYVYGGVDPVDCFTMAAFRMSSLFARTRDKETHQRVIVDVFPGTIEKTLADKYVTIYRLPREQFKEYKRKVTSSPSREWVSTDKVIPLEEVTIPALEMLDFIKRKGLLITTDDMSKRHQLRQVLPGKIRIWNLKHLKSNPNFQSIKDSQSDEFWAYYAPEFIPAIKATRVFMDNEIEKYNQEYFAEHKQYPDYTRKDEFHLNELQDRILPIIQSSQYIDDLIAKYIPQMQEKTNQTREQLLEQRQLLESQKKENELTNANTGLSLKRGNGFFEGSLLLIMTLIIGIILAFILIN